MEAILANTLLDNIQRDRLRTLLREALVGCCAPDIIGVTTDFHLHVRVLLEELYQGIQRTVRLFLQLTLTRFKEDVFNVDRLTDFKRRYKEVSHHGFARFRVTQVDYLELVIEVGHAWHKVIVCPWEKLQAIGRICWVVDERIRDLLVHTHLSNDASLKRLPCLGVNHATAEGNKIVKLGFRRYVLRDRPILVVLSQVQLGRDRRIVCRLYREVILTPVRQVD